MTETPHRAFLGQYSGGSDTDLVIPIDVLRAAERELDEARERQRRRLDAEELQAATEAAAAAARKSWWGRLRAMFRRASR
jgi:hypothetical protein